MTQFIIVTTIQGGDAVRLNVEAVMHYVRPSGENGTQILLTNGAVLRVREAVTELDELIRNTAKAAVISGD